MIVKMVHTTKHGHQSARFCPTDTGGRLVLDHGVSVDHGEMAASTKPERAFNALRYIKIGGFTPASPQRLLLFASRSELLEIGSQVVDLDLALDAGESHRRSH